jgi:hypothetical protein
MYDFRAIAASVDLRKLITADIGFPDPLGRWDCPFCGEGPERPPWCGDEASLCVRPDNRTFHCRDCKAWGNALDWLVRRMGIGIVEAARRVAPDLEAFRKPDTPIPASGAKTKSSRPNASKGGRKGKKSWDSGRLWGGRTFRIAELNIKHVGLPSQDAWAEARGAVAEMQGSADPEAAWRQYLDANPMLSGTADGRPASRSQRAS